ncbi:PAS domain S-box protein [Paenalcaligenes niemegkensis]|uniref:sensor histidine kinase n=1 Tax=Paenalcaligenes niemegkensis TaxID=2895469 RepID=UPI001EE904EA|nr:PAS domain-containing sensor histidine kinase [Paenalcaligenes niemegkensis]MCQ9617190.1 PAS domain S-box protein [Paenalcaligenes niemegkensis]
MITLSDDSENTKTAPSFASSVMSYVPILAIAILVILIALFIIVVQKDRMDEQRSKLIEDALWVEQNLSFHLRTHESNLERIAAEINATAQQPELYARLAHMKAIHPELLSIVWLGAAGEELMTLPQGYSPDATLPAPIPRMKAWIPAYFSAQQNDTLVDLIFPTFDEKNEVSGALLASISLSQLLTNQVPWWVAENYEVVLVDNSDKVIARRVKTVSTSEQLSHSMSVDPPLHGVRLRLTPNLSPHPPILTLLLTVIVGLAVLAIINLLIQHYYARKRLQAEQALRNEQAFRRAMENSITTGLRARDLQGRILYVNPAFCRLVGRKESEITGLAPPMPWWAPEVLGETLERHYQQNQMPRAQSFETRFQHPDGTLLDVQVHEAPLINDRGKHVGWMGSMVDISSRKAQEAHAIQQAEQLQQTAHLMSMVEMTTTLAHELNQPLAAVASYAAGCMNLLKNDNLNKAELHAGLEHVATQNRRAGEIIRRTHDFVRKREPLLLNEKLNTIVQDSIFFMQAELRKHNVKLRSDLPDEPVYVMADKTMIEQVILNLLRNAIEAVRHLESARRVIDVAFEWHDQHALIIISDNGPGVDESMVSLLFQPFASTKTQGMGIGLNICRSIVELHRGTLWYEATSTPGAAFVFTLPLTEQ